MIYPQKINAKKSEQIIKILGIASIVIAFLLILINQLTNPRIPWSMITNAGIIYIWVMIRYSIQKNMNIAGHVMLQTIAISILTVYIDYELGFKGWAINIAIPIIIMIANIAMLVLTIVSYKKYIKYAIYHLVIVAISMLPIIFLKEDMIQNIALSTIAIGISITSFGICLLLCKKELKEAIVRKFHI